jgi:N-acetyl-anhydromuramyl-L-alanine amidase AmpD
MIKFFEIILQFFRNLFKKKVTEPIPKNEEEKIGEEKMKLKEDFMPVGPDRPGTKLVPTSITIHWIGPYSSHKPSGVRAWWMDPTSGQASAHFVVKDQDVLACIPSNEVAWHAGNQKGNYYSIGIENIPKNVAGEFSEETINTLKELCADLKKKYPTITDVVRHYDWTKKDCPRFYTPVTTLVGDGGRVANPPGGEERWLELKKKIAPWAIQS